MMAQYYQDIMENFKQATEKNLQRSDRLIKLIHQMPEPQVGLTPKEVIWTKNKACLLHFIPVREKLHPVPILIIYALINRGYILDLVPGNSMVEYLLGQGFDVYMLDWGKAGPEDKNNNLDNYVLDYIPRAVNKVLRFAEAEELTLMSYCMGGTLAALYMGVYPEAPVRNMVFLAPPIDFEKAGLYTNWLSEKTFNIDKMVDVMGNIPAEAIDFGNKLLKPVTNFYSAYTSLWDRMWDQDFVDNWRVINKWVNDGTPFPGEAFRQWIKEFYQQNKLVKGELLLRGKKVDLKNIKCPVLNLTGKTDHIVQENQSVALGKSIGSKVYEHVSVPSGHVSLVIGKQAKKITWPKISSWLAAN